MARWVKLSDVLVQRAQSWLAESVERPESREKLDHVAQVALGGVSARDQRAMTAISPGADRMVHDGVDAPSWAATPQSLPCAQDVKPAEGGTALPRTGRDR